MEILIFEDDVLRYDSVAMDLPRREVTIEGESVELTPTEFSLLELLMRNPGRVLTRAAINHGVWGYDFGSSSNSLGVYVGYLRRKLDEAGGPPLIQTVRGVGYVLRRPRA